MELENQTDSDIWSVSSDADGEVEPELESMTGKGITHLCSELLELKRESEEDFQKDIFSNYSSFLRIFQEKQGIEIELMQLKHHLSTERTLVKYLVDGGYWNVLSEKTVEAMIEEEPLHDELSPAYQLETQIDDIFEILDALLLEHRLDEALAISQMEAQTFENLQLQGKFNSGLLMFYNSAMSERGAMLKELLITIADNPRVSPPELLKALIGLCELGDSQVATQLMLNYYHSRILSGVKDLQDSKPSLGVLYVRNVAKFVFSMISQAVRIYVVLHGETSSSCSELMQWACEETKLFAAHLSKYMKSISEGSGGLSAASEAAQIAISYCCLLVNQKIVLQPCLTKHIRPCVEEVLHVHIDHFKEVIGIFASTDDWVLGQYLVSGVLVEGRSSMTIGQLLEYCILTNSGWKFVMLLQAISKDISSLVILHMEGSILKGLMDLFTEYIAILERALTSKTNVSEKAGSTVNLAESLLQQVSVIANLSTVVHFFSSIIKNFFKDINHLYFEIESYASSVQETCSRLRAQFCKNFIHKIRDDDVVDCKMNPKGVDKSIGNPKMFPSPMPSAVYQKLFSELRKIEKVAETHVDADWLKSLLSELMEAIFVWIASKKESLTIAEEGLTDQHSGNFIQFSVDVQFLVEIARHGGYLSDIIINASSDLVSHVDPAFASAGFNFTSNVADERWVVSTATRCLQKLLELEGMKSNETAHKLEQGLNEHFKDDDALRSSQGFVVVSIGDSLTTEASGGGNVVEEVVTCRSKEDAELTEVSGIMEASEFNERIEISELSVPKIPEFSDMRLSVDR